MVLLLPLLLGLLFGCGLILSGMTDPAKVLGFLDVAGAWDLSLGLVMAGAIGVAILPFQWIERRGRSLAGAPLLAPGKTRIDIALLLGSSIFGIGWGLSGFCPGPALVGLGAGYLPAVAFFLAMVTGMEAYDWLSEALERRRSGVLKSGSGGP
jgi:uncharacterized protein